MQSGRATVYNEGATVESVDRLQTSTHAIGLPDAPVPEATLVHPQTTDHTLGPVAKLLGNRFPRFSSWWDSGSVSTPVKLMLLAIAGMIAIKQSDWLLPSALGVGLIYLIYYSVFSSTPKPQVSQGSGKKSQKKLSKKEAKRQKIVTLRTWLSQRPLEDRFTEIVGSLLVSALSCVVLNFLGLALSGTFLNPSIAAWSLYLWLSVTGIACCWAVILAGKQWEHADGHGWYRRIAMVVTGFAVGILAFAVANALKTDLSALRGTAGVNGQWIIRGPAPLTACILLFSGLFGLLRLWRQADPIRRTRVSIWKTGLCMVWIIVLGHILNLPTLYLCILALSVSISYSVCITVAASRTTATNHSGPAKPAGFMIDSTFHRTSPTLSPRLSYRVLQWFSIVFLTIAFAGFPGTAHAIGQLENGEVPIERDISDLAVPASDLAPSESAPASAEDAQLHNRELFTGTIICTLLGLLFVLFAFLKINHATRGFHGGRLQTLAIIAAGVWLVLGYAFYATWLLK